MKAKFKRSAAFLTACLPAFIFITWLNAYYWLLKGGHYQAFIQPKLWPLLILAMLLILAYAAAFISRFSLKLKISFQIDVWLKAATLFLPVLFLWTIYGQSLGSDAFAKRVFNPSQSVPIQDTSFKELPARTFSENNTTLLDLILYAEKLHGRRVAVEGMVYRGANGDKNSFKLFRFAVVCCAADALPFSVMVKTATQKDLQNDTWVRVEGLFNVETINDKQVSSIAADKILPISTPSPEKRYLFF
jgi:uncharacterized repeat protein (TIGR03943 family)